MNDFEKCYRLYAKEFGDDTFAKELFDKCFKYCKFYKYNNEIVAILFLLPCEIFIGDIRYSAKYIFAVTTDKSYRGKGIMTSFLNEIKNDEIFILKPSNNSLIDFYKKIGYFPFKAIKSREGEKRLVPRLEYSELSENYAELDGNEYTAMYFYKNKLDLDGLSFAYTME